MDRVSPDDTMIPNHIPDNAAYDTKVVCQESHET